jgi:hypothetical protein
LALCQTEQLAGIVGGQAMIEIIIFEIARAIGLLLCIILPAYAFAKSDIDEEM